MKMGAKITTVVKLTALQLKYSKSLNNEDGSEDYSGC